MTDKFKPGDVVYYDSRDFGRIAGIVADHPQLEHIEEPQVWATWKNTTGGWDKLHKNRTVGWMPVREVHHHPNADEILAEFTVWRLLKGD